MSIFDLGPGGDLRFGLGTVFSLTDVMAYPTIWMSFHMDNGGVISAKLYWRTVEGSGQVSYTPPPGSEYIELIGKDPSNTYHCVLEYDASGGQLTLAIDGVEIIATTVTGTMSGLDRIFAGDQGDDGDGYSEAKGILDNLMLNIGVVCDGETTDIDKDGAYCGQDCDDNDATKYPGAYESCDGVDNNCDGQIDEGWTKTVYYADNDGDGYGDWYDYILACAQPAGFVTVYGDCQDGNAAINPAAAEICDGIDNNCDWGIDWYEYPDADGDQFGDKYGIAVPCLVAPESYQDDNDDCDDSNQYINPLADEVCDGIDNDCDGSTDINVSNTYWFDNDGDGYGGAITQTTYDCSIPVGYVEFGGDCDDTNPAVHPEAGEICDDLDNDCDGAVNEGVYLTYYWDWDMDGFGRDDLNTQSCSPSGRFTALVGGDCNDEDASIYPGAPEVPPDGKDSDCDGVVDEACETPYTWYKDLDVDGFGDASSIAVACDQPTGYVANNADCNDGNPVMNPAADETCNYQDDDCNGAIDDGLPVTTYYWDDDGDGYGNPDDSYTGCDWPGEGYITAAGDCNDLCYTCNPGATEILDDNLDNDCDGQVDEACDAPFTWYQDSDGDTFGNAGVTTTACVQPPGYVADATDCDDTSAAINPGAAEVCNSVDDNCDGQPDEGLPQTTYYADVDGDGFGDETNPIQACADPGQEYAAVGGDCNDSCSTCNPDALESVDGQDNDCDGQVDEGDGCIGVVWYRDADGDTYGDPEDSFAGCQPSGYVGNNTDCDDGEYGINPNVPEDPNDRVDQNCDGDLGNCDPNQQWKNHPNYVKCVKDTVKELVENDEMARKYARKLIKRAKESGIGQK